MTTRETWACAILTSAWIAAIFGINYLFIRNDLWWEKCRLDVEFLLDKVEITKFTTIRERFECLPTTESGWVMELLSSSNNNASSTTLEMCLRRTDTFDYCLYGLLPPEHWFGTFLTVLIIFTYVLYCELAVWNKETVENLPDVETEEDSRQ